MKTSQHKEKTSKSGFTLIELMMVIAILGVLSAVAIPYYSGVQAKARRTEMVMNLAAIYTAQAAYYTQASDWVHTCTPAAVCTCTASNFPNAKDFSFQGFTLSGSAKFYGFCLDLIADPADGSGTGTFTGKAVGNIDRDPGNDVAAVQIYNREAIFICDDFSGPGC